MPNWRSNPKGAKMANLLFLTLVSSSMQTSSSWEWTTQSLLPLATKKAYFFSNVPSAGFNMWVSKKPLSEMQSNRETAWKAQKIFIYLNTPLKNKLSKVLHKLLTDVTARCTYSNKVGYPLEEHHLISAVSYLSASLPAAPSQPLMAG